MLTITDAASLERALDSPIEDDLKRLLSARRDQLMDDTDHEYELGELVHFIAADPSDSIADIETAACYPIVTEPAFEWVTDHGHWYEAATIISDSGFGVVLLVPNLKDADPKLLSLLRAEAIATAASAISTQAGPADGI